jgi:hypothetical protein
MIAFPYGGRRGVPADPSGHPEDAHLLYGFLTAAERDLFRMLDPHGQRHRAQDRLERAERHSLAAFRRSAVAAGDVKGAVVGAGRGS